ncbi:hypothetical protein YC2023_017444 [Brassica napus]
MFLHRRRQDVAIVGGQECEAKSETEEDEELRLIRSFKMECDRASSGGERQAAESNAALGGEKRRKRWRVTEKVVEEQQSNGGEQ